MPRGIRWLLSVSVGAGVVAGLSRAPEALARVDAFRVHEVRLEGAHFLTYSEALHAASVPPGASIWDDPDPLEERLARHPLVLSARVRRHFPDALVLEVQERTPVALVPTPALVAVDATGRALPLDPAVHRLDLPLINPRRRPLVADSRILPAELRVVARELGRLSHAEPQFAARVSEVRWTGGGLAARLGEPRIDVLFRPPLASLRLKEAMRALADAQGRWPEREPRTVDLRFADQVVVGYRSSFATE